ncbi:MAG: DNA repair protein RadA [Candidatus Margulisiibacteriota bacterium]|nr:MAG: DNA repair protein RadA [Candidatus Margulisbacteria bacterium GWD2_39_127]OGI03893.1 MAG: DNA repair protein RadA [Candidatus Margulisbacteria bacterium GWF2_38_17]OGI08802.1 MAG: DNA repair protein RadA [Candidatus Margulisbacteria bacterium GWE2_39_32]PZM78633.1 MAG: DNA repair protein RadA [Candidatus Margulisiibacteriota bacterium]HAR61974.1 DNA repair protein RadA [Candidatus Margulisiibacteriota bacterium]
MKKNVQFICQECGSVFPRWVGRCSECGTWNSIIEEIVQSNPKLASMNVERNRIQSLESIEISPLQRTSTNIDEFDRVVGGGIVKGSVILLGGDPGIGKSTICLQLCANLTMNNLSVLYVSGEESYEQIKMRGDRLSVNRSGGLDILCETDTDNIIASVKESVYNLIVIDSIQTLSCEDINSPPGSVSQLRENTAKIVSFAKTRNIPVIIIGHVNKEGVIAGPKIIEHMVDTVLYFEGQATRGFRIIRAIKNRFGSTNEIGIFEMDSSGLKPVSNPSHYFLTNEDNEFFPGSITVAAMEGTRPILHEIQALVSYCPFGIPRRTTMGIDSIKLSIIVAVLEKRIGLKLQNQDVIVKVVGGVKIDDPACDLAVACAIYSSFKNVSLPKDLILAGELGLAGELRNIAYLDARLQEVDKLGITSAIVPKQKNKIPNASSLRIIECATLSEVISNLEQSIALSN